uniref:Cell cycle regulator of NHEJ n=1 Tax=Coturnix japonica TaxID=93934 RepID=A0A8C2T9M0_COTJA
MAAAHKMAATTRRRELPAWMGTAGEGERPKGVPDRVRRRRQKGARAGGAGALPAISCLFAMPRAATVYCMNEAELVDVALSVLAEVKEQDHEQVEQELQAAPSQAPGGTASVEEDSDHSPSPPSPSGAGTDAERAGLDDSEDDALKYVREIFFT